MKETGSGQEQKDAADASLMVPALDPPSTDTSDDGSMVSAPDPDQKTV